MMLQLSPAILNQHILSLRTGGQVGTTTEPIINPNNLKIEGFHCIDRFSGDQLVLVTQDIREHIKQGFVVNDHEVLAEPDDLVRLEPIIKLQFFLIGKPVYSDKKRRIGKVNDYAVDNENMYVQKLYVTQNLLKNFAGGQLSVDRNQIVEITDRKIVIKEPLQGIKDRSPATVPSIAG